MENTTTILYQGENYLVSPFYDADNSEHGVDVRNDTTGEYLGEIIGLNIPDVEDTDEFDKFNDEVINWLRLTI